MVNREDIKSRIDTLPDNIIAGIDKFINRKIKQEIKNKNNAEYYAMLDAAQKGKTIPFTIEELEKITAMPIKEAKEFAVKRAAENGVELCL